MGKRPYPHEEWREGNLQLGHWKISGLYKVSKQQIISSLHVKPYTKITLQEIGWWWALAVRRREIQVLGGSYFMVSEIGGSQNQMAQTREIIRTGWESKV